MAQLDVELSAGRFSAHNLLLKADALTQVIQKVGSEHAHALHPSHLFLVWPAQGPGGLGPSMAACLHLCCRQVHPGWQVRAACVGSLSGELPLSSLSGTVVGQGRAASAAPGLPVPRWAVPQHKLLPLALPAVLLDDLLITLRYVGTGKGLSMGRVRRMGCCTTSCACGPACRSHCPAARCPPRSPCSPRSRCASARCRLGRLGRGRRGGRPRCPRQRHCAAHRQQLERAAQPAVRAGDQHCAAPGAAGATPARLTWVPGGLVFLGLSTLT